MHDNCYQIMERFSRYFVTDDMFVCDVGSLDVNGTFKDLFENYTGIDIVEGKNVDRVVKPYNFGDQLYDVVISGNCMEHVEDLHRWSKAVKKIIKPGGFLCITTPWKINEHRHPIDCWRIMPDGMRWLFKDMKIIDCGKQDIDTYLIARK